jgi:hypothetical protein
MPKIPENVRHATYDLMNRHVHVTCDAIFNKEASWYWEADGTASPCSDFIIMEAATGGAGSHV